MPSHPTPIRFNRILLTGAAGGLGRELRTRLKAYCTTLRLSDIADLGDAQPAEELHPAKLEDAAAVHALLPSAVVWPPDPMRGSTMHDETIYDVVVVGVAPAMATTVITDPKLPAGVYVQVAFSAPVDGSWTPRRA